MAFVEKRMKVLIENATITRVLKDDVLTSYRIAPNTGYMLHDKMRDVEELDERGIPTGNVTQGYTDVQCSCAADYDFENTKEINGNTAYGEREFFAIKVEEGIE